MAGGGGSLGTILVLGVLAAVVWTMFSSSGSSGYDDGYDMVGGTPLLGELTVLLICMANTDSLVHWHALPATQFLGL